MDLTKSVAGTWWCSALDCALVGGSLFFGREAAKTAGGRWDPEKQLWFVQYVKIEGTPLEKHIYVDEK